MVKLFLRLLVLVCFLVAGWTAYLLLTHQTTPVIGWLVLVVDIGVLVWNLSVLRKYRISFGSVILTGIILTVLLGTGTAFAGIEPMASYKDKVAVFFETSASSQSTQESPEPEIKLVSRGREVGDVMGFYTSSGLIELRIIKKWSGTESRVIRYTPSTSPLVINAHYKPTSKIKSSFSIILVPVEEIEKAGLVPAAKMMFSTSLVEVGRNTYRGLITNVSSIEIEVRSTGSDWTIWIGQEWE